jgi:hypothetical protein
MSAERAAQQIISATECGRAEWILSLPANLLARLQGLFPGATADLLGVVNRAIPHGSEAARRAKETAILRNSWFRGLTTLGRWAAQRYLQPGV